ncbi:hypothetical protein OPQ81_001814 [Rhizoctonia solani]|nr:hypothetical protein OPQ81_001814 [Rhizoctonia solani]
MLGAAVLLGSILTAGVYASTLVTSHQCVLDLGPSVYAICSSRSPTLVPFDRYEERHYTEIALHYLTGAKNVISTTGHNPHCIPDAHGLQSVSPPRARESRPYKATWTKIRYIASSLSESPCAEDIISEKVTAISVQTLPTHTSGDIEADTTSSRQLGEIGNSERPTGQLATTIASEDVDYLPMRRRATLGELCQLLGLFVVLGALHYISAHFAVRWQAPPPVERRSAQCE